MMGGDLRISARVSKRRGGIRVGPEAVLLSSTAIGLVQLVALIDDPDVRVEMQVDDDSFVLVSDEMRTGIRTMSDAGVADLAGVYDEVARRRLALGDIAGSIPGRGAGAEHPATHASRPVAQRLADPNPALPAAGGASDLGVEVEGVTEFAGYAEVLPHPSDASIDAAGLNGAADPRAVTMLDGDVREQIVETEIQALDGQAGDPQLAPGIDPLASAAGDARSAEAGDDKVVPAVDTVGAEGVVAAPSVEAAVGAPVVDAGEAATVADPAPATVATDPKPKPRRHR